VNGLACRLVVVPAPSADVPPWLSSTGASSIAASPCASRQSALSPVGRSVSSSSTALSPGPRALSPVMRSRETALGTPLVLAGPTMYLGASSADGFAPGVMTTGSAAAGSATRSCQQLLSCPLRGGSPLHGVRRVRAVDPSSGSSPCRVLRGSGGFVTASSSSVYPLVAPAIQAPVQAPLQGTWIPTAVSEPVCSFEGMQGSLTAPPARRLLSEASSPAFPRTFIAPLRLPESISTESGDPPEKQSVSLAMQLLKRRLRDDRQVGLDPGLRADLQYVLATLEHLADDLLSPPRGGSAHWHEMKAEEAEEDTLNQIASLDMDENTQDYLFSFSHKSPKRKGSKDMDHFQHCMDRLKPRPNGVGRKRIESICCPALAKLENLESWNDFDIFDVAAQSGDRPLQRVSRDTLEARGLVEAFHFQSRKLHTFLVHIEELYASHNPYHNSIHAADVTQSAHVLLLRGLGLGLGNLEALAVLVASLAHDVGHPGVTNDFLIKAKDEEAITYSDRSVNEHMHCATMFRLLRLEECDFLSESVLTRVQKEALRKMLIEAILATDMASHFCKLSALKAIIDEKGADATKWSSNMMIIEATVHAADLSNVCKPARIAFLWTDLVLSEFFAQGDEERRQGYEVSPLCDRETVSKPGSQVGFMNFIVHPIFMVLEQLADVSEPLENLQNNLKHWSEELAREKADKAESGAISPEPP